MLINELHCEPKTGLRILIYIEPGPPRKVVIVVMLAYPWDTSKFKNTVEWGLSSSFCHTCPMIMIWNATFDSKCT